MPIYLLIFLSLLFSLGHGKSIAIITYKADAIEPWDPDSLKTGLVGSEEAVIYMSQQLAKLGYKVSVFGSAPQNSPYSAESANPRFISAYPLTGSKFDILIAWRMPGMADRFREYASKVYLWPHDILDKSIHLTDTQINSFDDVLWLSEWQRAQWCSVNPSFAKYKNIYGNGINPEQFQPVSERKNPYSCIYGSNYARGLEILLNIWPAVKKAYPRATLDIYYGWQHWGLLSTQKEAKLRRQVAELASLDVSEHGLVSHEELNRAYAKSSFWTYPCIMPETFCITALRAQLAGCIPVINEGTALSETVRCGFKSNDPADYFAVLMSAMERAEKITLNERRRAGEFILKQFTWKTLAMKWRDLFEGNKGTILTPFIQKSAKGYTLIFPAMTISNTLKNNIVHYDKELKQLSRQVMEGKIKAESTNCWVEDDKHDFSRFQGVAGPLNFDDGYLMLVHEKYNADKHYDFHRFIYLDKKFHITKTSNLFTFKHKGIEQCLSMVTDHSGKNLIFSINIEESVAELCFIDLDTVRTLLKPLP